MTDGDWEKLGPLRVRSTGTKLTESQRRWVKYGLVILYADIALCVAGLVVGFLGHWHVALVVIGGSALLPFWVQQMLQHRGIMRWARPEDDA